MINSIKTLLLIATLAILSACGWHFQQSVTMPNEWRTLALESDDSYNDFTVIMRRKLQENQVNVVNLEQNIPILRINKQITSDQVASIFKHGCEAEKLLMLEVEATFRLANGESYPINAKVNRTFFDNARAALAKSEEREVIWNDMREQVARQLIVKIIALQNQIKRK